VTVDCECREALYCSKLCLDRDAEGEHKYKCRRFQEKNFEFNFNHDSLSGRVGLDNLGNSCYMNASIQCLSNSLAFTNFIVNDNVGILINKDNPLGHKGKIANAYLNTLKNLWCGSKKSFRAEYLKKSIGETNQLFAGTNQHDAQEFLLVLLDALHEDMNRSRNREQKKNLPELKGDD
jgi:ubiquitin C-terminal hydrolase